jgi:hypothetical protein
LSDQLFDQHEFVKFQMTISYLTLGATSLL